MERTSEADQHENEYGLLATDENLVYQDIKDDLEDSAREMAEKDFFYKPREAVAGP